MINVISLFCKIILFYIFAAKTACSLDQ